jgi:hypothetical protein
MLQFFGFVAALILLAIVLYKMIVLNEFRWRFVLYAPLIILAIAGFLGGW